MQQSHDQKLLLQKKDGLTGNQYCCKVTGGGKGLYGSCSHSQKTRFNHSMTYPRCPLKDSCMKRCHTSWPFTTISSKPLLGEHTHRRCPLVCGSLCQPTKPPRDLVADLTRSEPENRHLYAFLPGLHNASWLSFGSPIERYTQRPSTPLSLSLINPNECLNCCFGGFLPVS